MKTGCVRRRASRMRSVLVRRVLVPLMRLVKTAPRRRPRVLGSGVRLLPDADSSTSWEVRGVATREGSGAARPSDHSSPRS